MANSTDLVRQIDEAYKIAQHLPDDSDIVISVGAFKKLLTESEECPKDCEECHPPGCSCTMHN